MRVLKIVGTIVVALSVIATFGYLFRSDPLAMISGKKLSGEESPYPTDWSFTEDHMTIAVESRPDDPHSVTTVVFLHEGELYVPAQSGSSKAWTQYVLDDPRVRLKIGDSVYPAQAHRVLSERQLLAVTSSAARKYPQIASTSPEDAPRDVWLFKISSREAP